jgi:hypothetical protein
MRLVDAFLGLFAAVTLFAAAVMLNLDAAWYWVLTPPAIGMAALVVMAWHVRRTHKVLFVGRPELADGHRLEADLDRAGYMVVTCPGPHRRKGGCPVLAGGTCPIHWDADLAVVFESEDHEAPHAPCHEALGVPVLTLTVGSDAPLEPADDGATMGLDRPEPETVGTIDTMAR